MTKSKLRRPLVAMMALAAAAGTLVIACGDDDDTSSNPTADGGGNETGNNNPIDSGGTDAGPDATDAGEFTVDIGASYATACALSNKGNVQCWGDAVDGMFLQLPQGADGGPGKQCYDVDNGGPVDCDNRAPTKLNIGAPVEQLAVGYLTVCVIANVSGTKRLGCWGRNEDYRLAPFSADGGEIEGLVTTVKWLNLPSPPKQIINSNLFKMVLLEDGSIWGWGDNRFAQFGGANTENNGDGYIPVPEKVWPPVVDGGAVDAGAVIDVASNRLTSYVLTNQGIWGVGDCSSAEQCMGSPAANSPPSPVDGEIHSWTLLPNTRDIGTDAGVDGSADPPAKLFKTHGRATNSCFITQAGKAFCWSWNDYGQNGALRNELVDPVQTPSLIDIPADRKVTQIVAATGGMCALVDNGNVYCWGDNNRGAAAQDPPQGIVYTPGLVPGLTDVKSVAVGTAYFACAVTNGTHKTYCWGENGYGQTGSTPDGGSEDFSLTPKEVPLVW